MNKAGSRARRRRFNELCFRVISVGVITLTLGFLIFMLSAISYKGISAFYQTRITLDIDLSDPAFADLETADYQKAVHNALYALFPEVTGRTNRRALRRLISSGSGFNLRNMLSELPPEERTPQNIRVSLPADDLVDLLMKGRIDRAAPETHRQLKDRDIAWIDRLQNMGRIEQVFNTGFFTHGTSRESEQAGIFVALVSSLMTIAITFILSFPIGIASAIYLEEFAPQNRITDFIEVSINNLAAVPSIIFGLLGLAIFINLFDLPRSTPLVGGIVLALMTLPTVIIASRAAIKAVPVPIREAALALGVSPMQVVLHHVLPLSMPGMLTGSVIGIAQALGETAPLLIIGMVAFVVNAPTGITDPATALPVQIYLWASNPEPAFIDLAAAAIMVLIVTMLIINALAIVLRIRFEKRW